MSAINVPTPLVDLIQVRDRFVRSIHLERDSRGGAVDNSYIVTVQSRKALKRIAEGMQGEGSRAWTLTGPYGSGKSAFALFLTRLLCNEDLTSYSAREHLREADPAVATELYGTPGNPRLAGAGYLPILMTSAREPVSATLLRGLHTAVRNSHLGQFGASLGRDLSRAVRRLDAGHRVGSRVIVDWYARVAELAVEHGYSGLLVLLDELGKSLEHSAAHPDDGDVFVLQELAELAARSGAVPLLFVAILHQGFDQYGIHLDQGTRNEWAKVQGRFEDIAFQEPPEQMVRLVAAALSPVGPDTSDRFASATAPEIERALAAGICPLGMTTEEFREAARLSYPIHPVALVALPFLFRRYGQNERSLFSYLGSAEPHGFQEFVRSHVLDVEAPVFIRLPQLFDYFTSNLGPSLYAQAGSRTWIEAVDTLNQLPDPSPAEVDLIKSISLLGALGEVSHLRASDAHLAAAIISGTVAPVEVQEAIDKLRRRSLITYRQFNTSYRLWGGSDIDIEDRLAEGRRRVAGRFGLAESIQRYSPPRPMVARRHSFQTGTLRYFNVRYVDTTSLPDVGVSGSMGADGQLLLCLAEASTDRREFERWALSAELSARDNLLIAIPHHTVRLTAVLRELQSLHWVRENTPELRDDRVARRELAERIGEVETALAREIDRVFDPEVDRGTSGSLWYYQGRREEVSSRSDVSCLLSDVCDRIYSDAPQLRNELINRRSLSSAATAARHDLLEAMIVAADQEGLGLAGYPPSRSMYESLLAVPGIHRREGESWGFYPPRLDADRGLRAAWELMESLLRVAESQRFSVAVLFEKLKSPPLGLVDGPIPVLFSAILLHHQTDVALYEHGSFVPEFTLAVAERLIKDPASFEVQYCRIEGVRVAVLGRFASVLTQSQSDGSVERRQLVEIVRQLCQFVSKLPAFSKRTYRVSTSAQRVRQALLRARDPYSLLFDELPSAFDRAPFDTEESPNSNLVEGFFSDLRNSVGELQHAYDELLLAIERLLLDAFEVDGTGNTGRLALARRASVLVDLCVDSRLKVFLMKVVDANPPLAKWIEATATLLTHKPPKDWVDADLGRFELALSDLRRSFLHLERLAIEAHKAYAHDSGLEAVRVGVTTLTSAEQERVVFIAPHQREQLRHLREAVMAVFPDVHSRDRDVALAALAGVVSDLIRESYEGSVSDDMIVG